MSIMMDRAQYNLIIKNPEKISEYEIPSHLYHYYHHNYPFPNVNPMFFNDNPEGYWLEKINKMYYAEPEDHTKIDEHWYKIIRFE